MKKEKSCGTIIIKNDEVLIIRQKSGFCGFPKGHVENGETEVETAIRETKEETNIDVEVNESLRFEMSYITDKNIDKTVVFFVAKPTTEEIIIQEEELSDEVKTLIEERNIARANKNWAKADRIRDILTGMGVKISDKKI